MTLAHPAKTTIFADEDIDARRMLRRGDETDYVHTMRIGGLRRISQTGG